MSMPARHLPRELLDEHFRQLRRIGPARDLWELADQLTRLGKKLSELNVTIEVPDMPALGIKGGTQDLQRFIYWNFIKCFWSPDYGFDVSRLTNFDWYAPAIAYRFSREEFAGMLTAAGFEPDIPAFRGGVPLRPVPEIGHVRDRRPDQSRRRAGFAGGAAAHDRRHRPSRARRRRTVDRGRRRDGHRRLAIIDLSPAGHQPMVSADHRYVLSYNGEIYNFRELKAELEALGYWFRSRTDSEVVLNALGRMGPRRARSLQRHVRLRAVGPQGAARCCWRATATASSRFITSQDGARFAFGSEQKAILAHRRISTPARSARRCSNISPSRTSSPTAR